MSTATHWFPSRNSTVVPLYYRGYRHRGPLEPYTFDKDYVDRLTNRDAETEAHFSSFFQRRLIIKARSRLRSPELVEDAVQETIFRVLDRLRNKGGIERPECLGAYVHSVCENVVHEFHRNGSRLQQTPENAAEPRDQAVSAEIRSITEERKATVRAIMRTLPAADQEILRKVFLLEQNKDEICRELSMNRDYLRVRVHRAIARFRSAFEKEDNKAAR
jgi:RNA polymerase sigma-70 factor, ECF subfamily